MKEDNSLSPMSLTREMLCQISLGLEGEIALGTLVRTNVRVRSEEGFIIDTFVL